MSDSENSMADVSTPTLANWLLFRNGRTSPERASKAQYLVYGSNGVIGRADTKNVDGESIVIGRVGSYCGSTYFASSSCWVTDNAIVATAIEPGDTRFWYYVLSSLDLNRRSQGSGQPLLNQSILNSIPFNAPSRAARDLIAATLGALDDKIESNHQAQVTGEQLIRALVDSALGGAFGANVTLGHYCTLVKDPARTAALSADMKYIAFEHMPRGSIFLDNWGTAEGLGSDKLHFMAGDVLFGKLRPYFKKVGIAPVDGVCSTDILVLRSKRVADTALVAVVASSNALIDSLSAAATGTRMPRASWKDLADWPVPQLIDVERDRLASQAAPLVDRLTRLTYETHKLNAIRDALLPELLSGRILVRKAEEAVA